MRTHLLLIKTTATNCSNRIHFNQTVNDYSFIRVPNKFKSYECIISIVYLPLTNASPISSSFAYTHTYLHFFWTSESYDLYEHYNKNGVCFGVWRNIFRSAMQMTFFDNSGHAVFKTSSNTAGRGIGSVKIFIEINLTMRWNTYTIIDRDIGRLSFRI
jgi:hypothetical protein